MRITARGIEFLPYILCVKTHQSTLCIFISCFFGILHEFLGVLAVPSSFFPFHFYSLVWTVLSRALNKRLTLEIDNVWKHFKSATCSVKTVPIFGTFLVSFPSAFSGSEHISSCCLRLHPSVLPISAEIFHITSVKVITIFLVSPLSIGALFSCAIASSNGVFSDCRFVVKKVRLHVCSLHF